MRRLAKMMGSRPKRQFVNSSVPCGELIQHCRIHCCRSGLWVRLTQEDIDEGLKPALPVVDMLAFGEDGGCYYLDAETGGCKVWERRPAVCRTYTCEGDEYVRDALVGGPPPKPVWKRMWDQAWGHFPAPWGPAPETCPECKAPLELAMGTWQVTERGLPCLSCGAQFLMRGNGTAQPDLVAWNAIPGLPPHDEWVIQMDLGMALGWLQDWDGAMRAYRRAAEVVPDEAVRDQLTRLLIEAMVYKAAGEPKDERVGAEARELVERRLREKPEDAERIGDLGWLELNLGDPERGAELLAEARVRAPESMPIGLNLFSAMLKAGKAREAFSAVRPFMGVSYQERDTGGPDFSSKMFDLWEIADREVRLEMLAAHGQVRAVRGRPLLERAAKDEDALISAAARAALEAYDPFPPLVQIRAH